MNRTKPQISNVLEPLTTKQIAQTYIINDIIMHELILEAINSIEELLAQSDKNYSQSDIINRICVLISRDPLSSLFDIRKEDILWTLKTEYVNEILSLALYNSNQKK